MSNSNSTPRAIREVVIVGAARTPIGSFQGSLASVAAPRLGAVAILAALERAGVAAEQVQSVFMGEVLQGGVGQAPARQAALFAGLPVGTPCTTVNKVCGSGAEVDRRGRAAPSRSGRSRWRSRAAWSRMSNAPYFSNALRGGARMGNTELKDLMIHDGLWDPYNDMHMGMCGEKCAADLGFSRAAAGRVRDRDHAAGADGPSRRGLQGRDRAGPRARQEVRARADERSLAGAALPPRTTVPRTPSPTRSPRSSPRSRRTGPSPPPTPRASTTARRPWS